MKETFAILNEMVRDRAIDDYALAGAVAAAFYVQPFATHDIDVLIAMPETSKLLAEIPGIAYLKERGYDEITDEGIVIEGWPVQFLPVGNALNREAFLNACTINVAGTPVRVVLAEHLVAMMLELGRPKDIARVEMFLSQKAVDEPALMDIISRHGLIEKWNGFRQRHF